MLARLESLAACFDGELTTVCVGGKEAAAKASVILHGDPSEQIVQYCLVTQPDLVLIPARARWLSLRWLFVPSVVSAVLRGVECPVVLVPEMLTRPRIAQVVCAVRLDGSDDPVVEQAVAVACRAGAALTLVHVVPEVSEGTLAAGLDCREAAFSVGVARERIRELQAACGASRVEVRSGNARHGIADVVHELRADLVVTADDARGLMRHLACPVVSVPAVASLRTEDRRVHLG